MINIIEVPKFLTSAGFYKTLVKQINVQKPYHRNSNPIILDFSGTNQIEPLAVSNLLCMGKLILGETGTNIVIRIPETLKAGELKFYMKEIGFTEYAYGNEGVFEFESSPYSGLNGKRIDPLSGTLRFSENLTKSQIANGINGYVKPFAEQYLKRYMEYSEEEGEYVNKIVHFLCETVNNCCEKGKSDSFMTIHARYWDRKIYMAVSDIGRGFLQSWNELETDIEETEDVRKREEEKAAAKTVEYAILGGEKPRNEFEAILCGINKRKTSKIYGLSSVIMETLKFNGLIRIHSNDLQMIFTPKWKNVILERPEDLLKDHGFQKYNTVRNLEFKGAHIEIEVPF